MSVCIVGGNGFIGRHISLRFHQLGIPLTIISHSYDSNFFERYAPQTIYYHPDNADLWEEVSRSKFVIFLASASIPASNWAALETEIRSSVLFASSFFRRLLDVNPKAHVFYASSGGQIYGKGRVAPISEAEPAQPETSYAVGKQMIENVLDFHKRVDGASVTVFRLANPIGAWQYGSKLGFVAAAVAAAVKGTPITVFGDGGNNRDYFDVDEFADLLGQLILAEKWPTGLYNIGSGLGTTENQIVGLVEAITGNTIEIVHKPSRPFDLRYAVLDVSKAMKKLNWNPSRDLIGPVTKIIRHVEGTISR